MQTGSDVIVEADSAGDTRIGVDSGANGTVTVDGVGSTFSTNVGLTVGERGTGALHITEAGAVSSASGVVAFEPGSIGTVTVKKPNSTWTSGPIVVGVGGVGTMTISESGKVVASGTNPSFASSIGSSEGEGHVTVNGAGSMWTNNVIGLSVENGTLDITNGGVVSNGEGLVGRQPGFVATVTVDGLGSTWTSSDVLYVGVAGTGVVNVVSGGAVTSNGGRIGAGISGSGTVTIGTNSSWNITNELAVGPNISGTLDVRGTVSASLTTVGSQWNDQGQWNDRVRR